MTLHLNEIRRLCSESQAKSYERRMKVKGKDDFGKFTVDTKTLKVRYYNLKLPEGIEVENTILKDKGNYLDITDGTYAKFHRQVAHIKDRMEARRDQ